MGGGEITHLLSDKMLDGFSNRKGHLIASGLFFSEYVAKLYLNVTDNVTGWIKGVFFLESIIVGFAGQISLIKLK